MRFIINGGKKLEGEISAGGAKNGAFPLIAAALLTRQPTTLHNIPDISDIACMIELIENLGVEVEYKNHTLKIYAGQFIRSELDQVISKKLRASIVLVAPLLGATGKATFVHPGGDVIGERPIDLFVSGFKKMGATCTVTDSTYSVELNKPQAIRFMFPVISTTATMSLMTLATIAQGTTELLNAACEPEIVMLAEFLNAAGARITGAGTSTIRIDGIAQYPDREMEFTNIPDRVETGSLLLMGVAAQSNIVVTNTEPRHQDALLDTLERMGVPLTVTGDTIQVKPWESLRAVHIKTHEYPGFITDLQQPMVIAMTQAKGKSTVQETIFEGRMYWSEDLKRMGARVMILDTNRLSVEGPTVLEGKEVKGPDIRAGMAYVIAGLIAKGQSIIRDIETIDRGYENLENRLSALGADIRREK